MSGRQVALPAEETDIQITLICTSRTVAAARRDLRQIGGYFACLGSRGGAERDRRGCVWRLLEQPRPDIGPPPDREAGRNAKCLAPTGAARYALSMEISLNWGNFPRFWVQVPSRTQ